MIAIPLLARLGRSARSDGSRGGEPLDPIVAVASACGRGRPRDHRGLRARRAAGRRDADAPQRAVLAIDMDPARVAAERKAGKPVYFGDGSYPEFLRACGHRSGACPRRDLDTPAPSRRWCRQPGRSAPTSPSSPAPATRKHATELYEIGVDDAVPETIEASLQLSEAVLSRYRQCRWGS